MQRNQVRVERNELMQTKQKPAKVSATHFCLTIILHSEPTLIILNVVYVLVRKESCKRKIHQT